MTQVCVGGLYDGMVIQGLEDQLSCTENEGHVEDRPSAGGTCFAMDVSTSAAQSLKALRGGVGSLILAPLRAARDAYKESPIVQALERANDIVGNGSMRALLSDSQFRKEALDILIALSYFAAALNDAEHGETPATSVFTSSLYARVRKLGERIQGAAKEAHEREAIAAAVNALGQLADKDVGAVRKALGGHVSPSELSEAVVTASPPRVPLPNPIKPITYDSALVLKASQSLVVKYASIIRASEAIAAKGASLGALAGSPAGDVTPVTGGYMQTWQGCDIYYSDATGAHEVHGDIRAKYNALGGADGVLGLPVTDETGTPDGIGRFNHFSVSASIYWTPDTGPMMVRGNVRNVWSGQGWETGPLGYPVTDEHRMVTATPATDPAIFWSHFQNGAILSSLDGAAVALTADLAPDVLRRVIRKFFDDGFHSQDVNIGLEAPVDLLGISGWTYGFWASQAREITLRLHGFHDNGLLPDTTFELDMRLAFGTAWQNSFTEPTSFSIILGLRSITVTAHGLGSQAVADGVKDGVWDSFYPKDGPDPSTPWIPWGWRFVTDVATGADLHGASIDVLGILVTGEGGLSILLNPVPTIVGGFRKEIAQQKLDAFAQ